MLSLLDTQRLEDFGVVIEGNEGGLLAMKEESMNLVQPASDGLIPGDSIHTLMKSPEVMKAMKEFYKTQHVENYKRNKVSKSLTEYMWPLEGGDTRIEFRSPMPYFPPPGQLTVVSSNERGKKPGGQYCLVACDDGTVKWLHESECVIDGNHVWTVHWFDLRSKGPVYLSDRLQRPKPNVYNHYEINNYVGWNVNQGSGTQHVGPVNCRLL
ncbi:hypothetical protein vseg_003108 [Gypsophila vaccaria]